MNWQRGSHIYSPNQKFGWNQSHAQVPVVDTNHPGFWRIYYAARSLNNTSNTSYIDVEAGNPAKVIYQHEVPILETGRVGTFDENGIMPSCIITKDKQKWLYYIGWSQRKNVPYQNSIGLAISEDGGQTFHKYSEGPILGINEIDPFFTGTVFVLPDHKVYRAYYLSCTEWREIEGRLEPMYVLKYAESEDGIHWKREGVVAIPFRNEQEGGLVSATVIRTLSNYKMWYAYRNYFDYRENPLNSYRIGYAESENGINWIRKDDMAGITLSNSGWDSEMISYPYVVNWETKSYLFYNGNGFGKTGFGFAVSNEIL